ncbi:MAG: glycosyltransferase family 2 protein, partial [Actinomadura rubrobrunea]|nr:glycosyltransferase family 2 protein [Actinomadura rubrobrunea]
WLRRPLPVLLRAAAGALASAHGRRGVADAVRALPAVARSRRPVPRRVEAARAVLRDY